MERHPLDQSTFVHSSRCQKNDDGFPPNEQMAAQHASETETDHEEFLCDDCRAVDWSLLPTLAADGSLENENLALRSLNATVEELRNSSCKTCAIVSTIKEQFLNGKSCVLKALPLSRALTYDGHSMFYHPVLPSPDPSRCTVLSIFEEKDAYHDCFGPRSLAVVRLDELKSAKIAQTSVNYNNLKELIRICELNDKECCAARAGPNVLGLEVINTKTQEVIKAPDDCEYLALSYVWGKEEGGRFVHDIQNAQPVVKDAISVTNSMGYSYLWVDRYCISDPNDKHRMISQMDQIYANASITIIAAADGDTETGLSGVSKPRQPQRCVVIQDVALLELPLGHEDLLSSKWASRGWTYQEGFLSRRRIIFTATQILFLCNKMYAAESLQQLLRTNTYTTETEKFNSLTPTFWQTLRNVTIEDLLDHVQEYSKRELTRSTDSLDAFSGVLSYYTKKSADLFSPMLQLPWGLTATKDAHNTFSLDLLWYHEGAATRRAEFPSWSWTGWGGPLSFTGSTIGLHPERYIIEENHLYYLEWEISMQDVDGSLMRMYHLAQKEFAARKVTHRLDQPAPKQLQITCPVLPLSFIKVKQREFQDIYRTEVRIHHDNKEVCVQVGRHISDGVYPVFQVWKGIYVGGGSTRLDQRVEKQDSILALIFEDRDISHDVRRYQFLLVRQVSKCLHERVGLSMMEELDLDHPPKSQMVYMDAMGDYLNSFGITDTQSMNPFADTAELRTICLE